MADRDANATGPSNPGTYRAPNEEAQDKDAELELVRHSSSVCWCCHHPGHRASSCLSKSGSSEAGSGARSASIGGCTASSGQKRKNPSSAEARAFQMSVETTTATDDVITGMFLINSIPTRVLFEFGANRTFMSLGFCAKIKLHATVLSELVRLEVVDGKMIPVTTYVSGVSIEIDGRPFDMSCIMFHISSCDVVIGMNWLSLHKASIKCDMKTITFRMTNGTHVVARRERVHVIDAKKEKKTIADILAVSEFLEVFLDELPGLLPVKEVEYKIELVPETTPVAKAPYHLAPSEIREMMSRIQELLSLDYLT
ncbi:uncharacterized protein [Rutidosis leptorrhynchoides]|uniref:uncharacterized protein n=1 Tax=Rutidosis leptorrhynchoides TaxID=125765 RepID=UPI003A99ED3E